MITLASFYSQYSTYNHLSCLSFIDPPNLNDIFILSKNLPNRSKASFIDRPINLLSIHSFVQNLFHEAYEKNVYSAMKEWMERTCVQFTPRGMKHSIH